MPWCTLRWGCKSSLLNLPTGTAIWHANIPTPSNCHNNARHFRLGWPVEKTIFFFKVQSLNMIGKLALTMGMITTQRRQSKAFGEEFIIASTCFLSFRIQIMHFSNMAIYFQYYPLVRTVLITWKIHRSLTMSLELVYSYSRRIPEEIHKYDYRIAHQDFKASILKTKHLHWDGAWWERATLR
jgi:hypothetical protein